MMKYNKIFTAMLVLGCANAFATNVEAGTAKASDIEMGHQVTVDDASIATERQNLAINTQGKGYGPQAPRDIDNLGGTNDRFFGKAPPYNKMNLCNIHFHKNAEHKGGQFTTYAGNGDGKGFNTGYRYSGMLTESELKPYIFPTDKKIKEEAKLQSGDTIELHYVFTTAKVTPDESLSACLDDSTVNPQLRVEAQVFVLVNDDKALDFNSAAAHAVVNGFHQAIGIPTNTGKPIEYPGSTTGPAYNEKGSPFQVTWSVRPKVAKVNVASVHKWLEKNDFNEKYAHGVRNLVVNPDLLAEF